MESGRAGSFPRSDITSCANEGGRSRSFREVTRCEQPARASAGASKIQTRSGNTAPAGTWAHGLGGERLVIERPDDGPEEGPSTLGVYPLLKS
jgi:hypothetical protein